MRWTWLIEQIESLLRWFFEKFLSIAGGHLFNPFSKMLLWSVLLLQDAAESARKAEQSRKRAEDIAAGTVQMNGRELFLHEPWVFDDSRVWGFFSLAQTAFHSVAANASFLLTRVSSMIYHYISRNILLEIQCLCLWQIFLIQLLLACFLIKLDLFLFNTRWSQHVSVHASLNRLLLPN